MPKHAAGLSGELAVGAGGERRRALVADADEREVAGVLLAAHCVGEAEVGVSDHPEHVGHAPGDHGLDHDVGDGADVLLFVGHFDVDAVVAHLDREARGTRR